MAHRHTFQCLRMKDGKVVCGESSDLVGEFVSKEIRHMKHKKHRFSPKQAIAIGLSMARAAGLPVRRKPR